MKKSAEAERKHGQISLQGHKQRMIVFCQGGQPIVLHYRKFRDRRGKVRRVLSGKGLTDGRPRP